MEQRATYHTNTTFKPRVVPTNPDADVFYLDVRLIDEFGHIIKAHAIAVYSYLCHIADEKTQSCTISFADIAKVLPISRNTAATAIQKLCAHNIIRKEVQFTPQGGIAPSRYILLDSSEWSIAEQEVTKLRLPKNPMKHYHPGFVYLIAAVENPILYKIGVTVNLETRLKGIQNMSPIELNVLHTIETDQRFALERELHKKFAAKRKHGEWFALDEADIDYILSL